MKIILSPQPPPLLSFWFQAFRLSHRWKAKQCAAHGPSRIFTDVAETCCPSGKELTRKAITWVHQPATVFTDTSSRLIRINRHNPKSGIDMKSELWQSHPWPFRPQKKRINIQDYIPTMHKTVRYLQIYRVMLSMVIIVHRMHIASHELWCFSAACAQCSSGPFRPKNGVAAWV